MASWKPYRVSDVVSEIDEEKYVLPVIQRELVWTEDKMELLFDSLLKGNSFDGIIVIEEDKDSKPLFASRVFSKDGNPLPSQNKEKLSQTQYFVIDGQQRLQSFYIGLKGTYHGKSLFFDLFSDYKNDYDFEFEKEVTLLPTSTKEERPIKDCLWYSAKDLLRSLKETGDEEQVAENIINNYNISDSEKKTFITKNVKAFYRNIISVEAIGVAKVTVNKSLPEIENRQKIVELFRRLNDGGTKLSALDLVASTLKGFDYRMEAFLRGMEEEFTDIGLSPENLIKLIFLLQDNHTKEMTAIETSDAEFAIQNQERIKNSLKAVRIFLEYSHLYEYYKNANRSFIPLFFVAYHIFHKNITDSAILEYWNDYETSNVDFKPMLLWIYKSLLNGVFRSKGAGWIPYKTGIKKILSEIKEYKNKVFPSEELFKVYIDHPIVYTSDFTAENLDKLDAQFVFYLIYDRKRAIRTNDIDHIMPKNILEEKEYTYNDINSIKNYQLLDYGTNRGEKNGKAFSVWVNNPEYVKDKKLYIETHLIPTDESLWSEDRFLEFKDERAKLIVNKINSYLN